MPLDPRIAMGFQSPQFESPVNMMGNMMKLKSMQQQNALAEQQMADLATERARTALLNKVYGESVGPNGMLDYAKVRTGLAQSGQGALLPGIIKQEQEEGEARSKRGKADLELFAQGLEARSSLLNPNMTPEAYLAWHEGNHKDPVIGPMLEKMGVNAADSRAQIVARIQRGELPQLIAESALGVKKLYDAVRPVETAAGIEMMTPTGTTLAIRRAPPKGSGVTINTGDSSANEFGKGVGKGAAEQFNESYKGAQSARASYGNTDKLYQFVNSNDFISGPAGDWRSKAASFLGLPGVAETDAYFSQIGSEVAQAIKQFGAGTGLSDNDRKYAEQIAGGQRALTKETIRTIMYMRQMANRNIIKAYNEDRAFKAENNPRANITGLYQEIPVPPPPSFNGKGWSLHRDKNGNYAYVSPDGKQTQEVQ